MKCLTEFLLLFRLYKKQALSNVFQEAGYCLYFYSIVEIALLFQDNCIYLVRHLRWAVKSIETSLCMRSVPNLFWHQQYSNQKQLILDEILG